MGQKGEIEDICTVSRGHRKIQTSHTVSRDRRKIQTSHPRIGQNGEIDDIFHTTETENCLKYLLFNRNRLNSELQHLMIFFSR